MGTITYLEKHLGTFKIIACILGVHFEIQGKDEANRWNSTSPPSPGAWDTCLCYISHVKVTSVNSIEMK